MWKNIISNISFYCAEKFYATHRHSTLPVPFPHFSFLRPIDIVPQNGFQMELFDFQATRWLVATRNRNFDARRDGNFYRLYEGISTWKLKYVVACVPCPYGFSRIFYGESATRAHRRSLPYAVVYSCRI